MKRATLPGCIFSPWAARAASPGRSPSSSSRERKGVLDDSPLIVRWADHDAPADRKLLAAHGSAPYADSLALERHLDVDFAPNVRRLACFHRLLSSPTTDSERTPATRKAADRRRSRGSNRCVPGRCRQCPCIGEPPRWNAAGPSVESREAGRATGAQRRSPACRLARRDAVVRGGAG